MPDQVGRHRVVYTPLPKVDSKPKHHFSQYQLWVLYQYMLQGLVCDLHYEVLPESETSFSVTLHRPDADSLAVCEHLLQIITKI